MTDDPTTDDGPVNDGPDLDTAKAAQAAMPFVPVAGADVLPTDVKNGEIPDTTNPDADDGSVTHTEGEA
jgi:hypothetical protein